MIRTWRLDARSMTLVLAAEKDALPEVAYWGPPLPAGEEGAALYAAQRLDVTGGMLDENPPLSLCPERARLFPGQPGLSLRDATGAPRAPNFRYAGEDRDGDGIALRYRDGEAGLDLSFHLRVDAHTGMIVAQSVLETDAPVHLDWLAAPVFPAPSQATHMIEIAGRWCGEFQLATLPWSAGARLRDNGTGRTGHEHFPGLLVPLPGATNTGGEVYGFHYGWSGGHRMLAEELPDGRRQIQFGHATGSQVGPGQRFETAPLYAVYSDAGLNGCAIAFQRHARNRIVRFPDPDRPRPVHYNCWEAVYFDHDLDTLKDIAARAADLGAERFVLDDGWFGRRDDDTSSLGDWVVDARKFPDGLTPLADHVAALGMRFGLWVEPEMINPDSDLFRAHPDWALGPADQPLGRGQLVLDLAREEVRGYLFDRIAAILERVDIDYLKWDHNRVLPGPDAAQTRGTYALIDRLRARFPAVEIESCASGGGRIDFGILARTHRVWLSDSNDALERLRMQADAALFLPGCVTGSHVGPRVCHTSGRVLDIRLRAWVAAQRHMGFEMDPRELTRDEAEVLRDVTAWWKANRGWLMSADIYRLDSADPSVIAELQMAEAGDRFVVFAGKTATSSQIAPRPLRLTGLEPDARYRLSLRNAADARKLSRGPVALSAGPVTLSGRYLMSHGVTLPWSFPQSIWVLEGRLLDD